MEIFSIVYTKSVYHNSLNVCSAMGPSTTPITFFLVKYKIVFMSGSTQGRRDIIVRKMLRNGNKWSRIGHYVRVLLFTLGWQGHRMTSGLLNK